MTSDGQSADCYSSQLYSSIGRKMYLSDETGDFHFIFESGAAAVELVPVHKHVLSAGSKYFSDKFNGPWKHETAIKVTQFSCEAFKEFLRFFYFDQVLVSIEHIVELIDIAEKFGVDECLNVCSKFLDDPKRW